MNDCLSTGSRHFHCTHCTFNGVCGDKMNQRSNPSLLSHCNELYTSVHDALTVRRSKNETTSPTGHHSCPVTLSPSTSCTYTSSNHLVTPLRCKAHMKHEKDDIMNKCVTCVPCNNNCKCISTAKGEVTHPLSSSPPTGQPNGRKRHHYTSSAIKLVLILSNVLLPLLLLLSRNVSSSAALPNYQTKLACEGQHLHLSCDDGYKLNIIRANFGRFSLSPCNSQGIADWPANCMSRKSFRVAQETCGNRTECTLHATTSVFSDPCPAAVKYLEVQYQCLAEVSPTVGSGVNSRPSLHSSNMSPASVTGSNVNTVSNVNELSRARNSPSSSSKSLPSNAGVFASGSNNNNNNNGNNRNRKVSTLNSLSSASSSEYDSSEDRRVAPNNFTSAVGSSSSSSVPLSPSTALNSRPNYPDSSSNIGTNSNNNVASYGDSMAGTSHSPSGSNNNNNGHGSHRLQQPNSNNNDDRNSVNSDTLNLDHSGLSSSSSGTSSSSPSPSSLPHHHTYPHPIIVPTPNFNPSANSQHGNNNQFIPPSIEPAIPNHHHLPNSTGIIHNSPESDDYEGTSSSLDSSSNFNDVTSTLSSSSLPLTESLRLFLTIGCVFGIICLFLTMLSLVMTSAATSSSSSSSSPSSSHLLNSSTVGTNSASAAAAVLSSNNHSPAIESGLLGTSTCRSFTKSLRLELQVKQNLTLCLLIVEILLLIGINVSQNKFFCGIIAGTLHYFFLSIFIWLFFDGFTLYLALLKHQEVTNPTSNSPNGTVQLNHSPNSGSVLDVTSTVNRNTHRVNSAQYSTQLSANGDLITSAHKSYHNQIPLTRNDNCCSRSAKCYLLLAYGLPLVIQVTSSLLDTGSPFWISSSLTHCWLRSDKYFVLTFVGPVIAVLSANFLFLAITVVCSNYGSLFSSFDKFSLDETLSHPVHHRSHHHLSSFNSNLPMYMNDYTIYTTNSLRKRLRTSLTIFVVMSLTLTALFVSLCQELPDDDLIFTSCLYTFALFNPIQVIVMLILFSSSTSIAKANSLKVLTSLGLFNGDSSASHHNSTALTLANDKSNMALTSSSMNHGHGGHGHSVIHSTLLAGSSNVPTNNLNVLNSLDSNNSASAVRYVNTVGKDMQQMLLAHHSLSNGNSCHSSDLPIIPPPIHTSTLNLSEINGGNGGGNGNTGTISSTGADGGSIQSKPYSASDYGFRKNLGSTSVSLTYRSPVYGTTAGNNTSATLISTSTPVASSASVSSSGVTVTTSNSNAAQASLAASIAMRRAAVNAAGASVHVHTKQCLQFPCPYPHVVEHVYESIDEDPYVARLLLPVSTPMINRKVNNGNGNNLNC